MSDVLRIHVDINVDMKVLYDAQVAALEGYDTESYEDFHKVIDPADLADDIAHDVLDHVLMAGLFPGDDEAFSVEAKGEWA